MKTLFALVSLFAVFLLPMSANAGHGYYRYAFVYNGHNDGPGSLRAALERGASTVIIKPWVSTIDVSETLVYSGRKTLKIIGTGQTIDGADIVGDGAILEISKGANLYVRKPTFGGRGRFQY